MKSRSCVVIDYGIGNTFSVLNALKINGINSVLTNDYQLIKNADSIILPGVGAFGKGMEKLSENKIIDGLIEFLSKERPLLGICLGMQLLMEIGYELGEFKGLGLIPGEVSKINIREKNLNKIKVPLIGWYKTTYNNNDSYFIGKKVGEELDGKSYYYIHSYSVLTTKKINELAYVDFGNSKIVAAICKNNIIGVQFHPEKSQKNGLQLIENFCNWKL